LLAMFHRIMEDDDATGEEQGLDSSMARGRGNTNVLKPTERRKAYWNQQYTFSMVMAAMIEERMPTTIIPPKMTVLLVTKIELNRDDDNTTTCSWGGRTATTGAAMEATTEAGDNATTAQGVMIEKVLLVMLVVQGKDMMLCPVGMEARLPLLLSSSS
jgi:hypothetical protein